MNFFEETSKNIPAANQFLALKIYDESSKVIQKVFGNV